MTKINLKQNLAFSSSSQIVTIIASFVINWFLARHLGPDLRGRYVYLFTINSIVWMLLDLGVGKTFTYSLQHDTVDPRKLYSYSIAFFCLSLIFSIIFFAYVSPLSQISGNIIYPKYILIALGLYVVSFQLFTRLKFLLIGLNRIKEYAVISCLPTVAFLLLLIPTYWIIPSGWKMEYAYLLNVSTIVICILIFHFRLSRLIQYKWTMDVPLIKNSYRLGFKAFLSEYLIILMTRVDQLILKALGTFSQLGIYTLSVNYVDMINTMCNMFGVVLLTKFSSITDDNEALTILRKIFILINVLNTLCILFMFLIGKYFIVYLYGVAYQDAYWSFLLMIPAVFGLTMGALFNTFLWSKGFPVFTIIAPMVPLIIKSVISYYLIPHFSYFGTAIASSISYVLWFLILLVWYFSSHPGKHITQLIPHKQDFRDAYKMFLQAKKKVLLRLV